MRVSLFCCALLCAASVAWAEPDTTPAATDLEVPVRLLADGKPIDVPVGHAAPYVVDWNRDGKPDLLVGQFGEGKLRIFLNEGTAKEPIFGKFEYFRAEGEDATVPTG